MTVSSSSLAPDPPSARDDRLLMQQAWLQVAQCLDAAPSHPHRMRRHLRRLEQYLQAYHYEITAGNPNNTFMIEEQDTCLFHEILFSSLQLRNHCDDSDEYAHSILTFATILFDRSGGQLSPLQVPDMFRMMNLSHQSSANNNQVLLSQLQMLRQALEALCHHDDLLPFEKQTTTTLSSATNSNNDDCDPSFWLERLQELLPMAHASLDAHYDTNEHLHLHEHSQLQQYRDTLIRSMTTLIVQRLDTLVPPQHTAFDWIGAFCTDENACASFFGVLQAFTQDLVAFAVDALDTVVVVDNTNHNDTNVNNALEQRRIAVQMIQAVFDWKIAQPSALLRDLWRAMAEHHSAGEAYCAALLDQAYLTIGAVRTEMNGDNALLALDSSTWCKTVLHAIEYPHVFSHHAQDLFWNALRQEIVTNNDLKSIVQMSIVSLPLKAIGALLERLEDVLKANASSESMHGWDGYYHQKRHAVLSAHCQLQS